MPNDDSIGVSSSNFKRLFFTYSYFKNFISRTENTADKAVCAGVIEQERKRQFRRLATTSQGTLFKLSLRIVFIY